ncbi:MAG: hypothetical protein IJH12_06620 [Clostridia bacterium]|nr:hypothetical protein [Clostridia bacterium]
MELMYPIAIVIFLVISIVISAINFKEKEKYTTGRKVANTKYIKESEYYKSKVRKYRVYSILLVIVSIFSIFVTSVLIARPITKQIKSDTKYNRDILIGLDISLSECKVNLELVKKFRKIIPNIEGDRIGIVLYNTAPIVYCPLTDDYDYIDECLKTIEEQLNIVIENNGYVPYSYDEKGMETRSFWYGGTIANNREKGSSLVGDGLAGTISSFPDLKEDKDRTRIVIFATDNDVAGTQTITLEEACKYCKQYNINLYAYCPSVDMNIYTSKEKIESYRKAVEEIAGGKFYVGDLDRMSSSIVNEIKDTKTTAMKTSVKTIITDHPEFLCITVTVLVVILIILEKRIKL